MSTILVDPYGNPLVADPVGPMFGPTRFEDQPAKVRRRGRKGLALKTRSQRYRQRASWARGRGDTEAASLFSKKAGKRRRSSSKGTSRKSRRGRSSTSARNRRDYRKFLAKRSKTFGPVAFKDQPTWVRERGRKGKSATRSTRRSARRSAGSATSSKQVRRLRREGAITRKQARKLNRQLARQQRTSGKSRKSRGSRKSTRSSRSGASKVLTYNSLMSQLRKRKGLKAWVCVGEKRTGCGGGRKGYRGSRQLGVLRP